MSIQQPQTPQTTNQRLGVGGWLVAIGITLGALVGIGLITLAVVISSGAVLLPNLPTGISMGDMAALVAAGATLLLADFTALLAWVTRRSIDATQREAEIAAAALTASNRQADVAEKALKAAQDQVDIAKEQLTIAKEQAAAASERVRMEREQLAASTRPHLVEPRNTQFINITPDFVRPFTFAVVMVNLGPGIASIAKGLVAMGSVVRMADAITPKIVTAGDEVRLTFNLSPQGGISDQAIANAMVNKQNLQAGALYSDITGQRAWRSRGSLISRGSTNWLLIDVKVEDVPVHILEI